jgi:PhoH-like ATPase
LDSFSEQGDLTAGVVTPGGGLIRMEKNCEDVCVKLPKGLSEADLRILTVAYNLAKDNTDVEYILVSQDINMRLIAKSIGIKAQAYKRDETSGEVYSGNREVKTTSVVIDKFHKDGSLAPEELNLEEALNANEFVWLVGDESRHSTTLARYDSEMGVLVPIDDAVDDGVFGIVGANKEQKYCLDLLLNPDVDLVTILGGAGTGKTLLAFAAGLQDVSGGVKCKKVMLVRPLVSLGAELGFYPGTKDEKIKMWMSPFIDSICVLQKVNTSRCSSQLKRLKPQRKNGTAKAEEQADFTAVDLLSLDSLVANKMVELEAPSQIRGRSLSDYFVIVDEAQNLTPHEIYTIITRAGENSTFVFTGDAEQIDHPYLNSKNNGLVFLINLMKNHPIVGHITLTGVRRSRLSMLAQNRYDKQGGKK